jgi:hypothetical protein
MTRNCDCHDRPLPKCETVNSGNGQRQRQGNKTDEGTMMLPAEREPKFNPVAIAQSRETQTLTPVTAKDASDILNNCTI